MHRAVGQAQMLCMRVCMRAHVRVCEPVHVRVHTCTFGRFVYMQLSPSRAARLPAMSVHACTYRGMCMHMHARGPHYVACCTELCRHPPHCSASPYLKREPLIVSFVVYIADCDWRGDVVTRNVAPLHTPLSGAWQPAHDCFPGGLCTV